MVRVSSAMRAVCAAVLLSACVASANEALSYSTRAAARILRAKGLSKELVYEASKNGTHAFQFPLARKHHPGVQEQEGSVHRRLSIFEQQPMYGSFRQLAYYYVDVFIGTPPQRFSVIADTGSSLLAVPCHGCTHCGTHQNPGFDISKSSTAQSVPCTGNSCSQCYSSHCGYYQSYTEGSKLRGYYYEDKLWMGGDSSSTTEGDRFGVNFRFGCHTFEDGMFTSQLADGIMGMSRSHRTLYYSLFAAHKLTNYMFGLCLKDTGGVVTIGDVDTRLHKSPMVWTSMASTSGTYMNVQISKMRVGGRDIATTHSAIIDSGTSFTYIDRNIWSTVTGNINAFCGVSGRCKGTTTHVSGEGMCYRLASAADISTFPSVVITVGAVTITMEPEMVFMNMDWDRGAYCLGLYKNEGASSVIGANAMHGHDFVFDVSGNRFGVAPSDCQLPTAPAGSEAGPSSSAGASETGSEASGSDTDGSDSKADSSEVQDNSGSSSQGQHQQVTPEPTTPDKSTDNSVIIGGAVGAGVVVAAVLTCACLAYFAGGCRVGPIEITPRRAVQHRRLDEAFDDEGFGMEGEDEAQKPDTLESVRAERKARREARAARTSRKGKKGSRRSQRRSASGAGAGAGAGGTSPHEVAVEMVAADGEAEGAADAAPSEAPAPPPYTEAASPSAAVAAASQIMALSSEHSRTMSSDQFEIFWKDFQLTMQFWGNARQITAAAATEAGSGEPSIAATRASVLAPLASLGFVVVSSIETDEGSIVLYLAGEEAMGQGRVMATITLGPEPHRLAAELRAASEGLAERATRALETALGPVTELLSDRIDGESDGSPRVGPDGSVSM